MQWLINTILYFTFLHNLFCCWNLTWEIIMGTTLFMSKWQNESFNPFLYFCKLNCGIPRSQQHIYQLLDHYLSNTHFRSIFQTYNITYLVFSRLSLRTFILISRNVGAHVPNWECQWYGWLHISLLHTLKPHICHGKISGNEDPPNWKILLNFPAAYFQSTLQGNFPVARLCPA